MNQVLLDTPVQRRAAFVSNVAGIVGRSNVRGLWTPVPAEGGVFDPIVGGRKWGGATGADGSRVMPLGKGYSYNFNGTSNFFATVDAPDLSFVSGTDQPFTMMALANVVDTANARVFASKNTSPNSEYEFRISTADLLNLIVFIQDGSHFALRASNAAIPMGSWVLFGATYSAATGGATAANDMTLYVNGAAVASTATNDALYTTMTDTTSILEVGSVATGTLRFFQGQMALLLILAGNTSAATHAAMMGACRSHFGVPA